jgi:hypothetical protein
MEKPVGLAHRAHQDGQIPKILSEISLARLWHHYNDFGNGSSATEGIRPVHQPMSALVR